MPKGNKSKRTQKKNRKRNQTDGWSVAPNAKLGLPRSVSAIMPDRMMTRLNYKGVQNLTIAAASSFVTRRWAPTAVYDVDPTLGSTTVVGFNELSLLYNNYRTVRSTVICRAATTGAQPASLIVIPLNADPGSSPSSSVVNSWYNNTYGKVKLVPAVGGPVISIKHNMTTEKIYGSKMIYFDDNFASLINTVPVNNWYWAIAVVSPVTAGSNLIFTVEFDIIMDVEFYSRKNLLN